MRPSMYTYTHACMYARRRTFTKVIINVGAGCSHGYSVHLAKCPTNKRFVYMRFDGKLQFNRELQEYQLSERAWGGMFFANLHFRYAGVENIKEKCNKGADLFLSTVPASAFDYDRCVRQHEMLNFPDIPFDLLLNKWTARHTFDLIQE